jgi:hypothetical protein
MGTSPVQHWWCDVPHRGKRMSMAAYCFPVSAIGPAAEADAPALARIAVAGYQH